MPFWRTYYHLVWATKKRKPIITPEIEPRLHTYILNKAVELGIYIYEINGWLDHVHLIVAIPPKHSVVYVVKRLKGASSYDLNLGGQGEHFAWQRGYGVLTLGEKQRQKAEEYVRRQKEHHTQQTTNAWLERTDAYDEGPFDTGMSAGVVAVRNSLREPEPMYELEDSFPF